MYDHLVNIYSTRKVALFRLILMVSVSVFESSDKISCDTNKDEDKDTAFKSYLAKFVFLAQHVHTVYACFTIRKSVEQSAL